MTSERRKNRRLVILRAGESCKSYNKSTVGKFIISSGNKHALIEIKDCSLSVYSKAVKNKMGAEKDVLEALKDRVRKKGKVKVFACLTCS